MANDHNEDILLDLFHPSLRLIESDRTLKWAREEHRKVIEAVKADCTHTTVFRCEWQESPYGGSAQPPILQCTHCLLEESEWGSGPERMALGRPYETGNGRKYLTISREALYGRRVRGG